MDKARLAVIYMCGVYKAVPEIVIPPTGCQ